MSRYYSKPKNGELVIIVIATLIFVWMMLLMAGPNNPFDLVRMSTTCRDGRQVSIRVQGTAEENTAEFLKQGCVQAGGQK
jgi:hypothetical protein